MAAMMILMVVFLIAPGFGGHMGMHGANDSPSQAAQSHERGAAKPVPRSPETPLDVPIEEDQP